MGGHRRRRHRLGRSALILIALTIALVTGCSGENDRADQSTSQPTPVRLDAPPTDLTWTGFNGMSIPQALEGPHTDNPIAPSGFDQSPAGAALAAINATIRISVANDSQWPQIVRTSIAPGAARDEFIAARIQLATTADVPAGQAPQVMGWKVTNFSPEQATVEIYTQLPDQSWQLNHTTVVWTALGDWGLVLPSTTAPPSSPAVTSIDSIPPGAVRIKGA